MIISFILLLFILRLFFLKISIKNEKEILKNGGMEYGVKTTKCLTFVHILFYVSCLVEAYITNPPFDIISLIGVILVIISMIMLYIVTRLLKGIWTVKLMIVKNHQFNNHWLFRNIKHPNYFLNIIPELLGITLICHAYYSAIFILPIYALILYLRIKEENHLLKTIIIPNTK